MKIRNLIPDYTYVTFSKIKILAVVPKKKYNINVYFIRVEFNNGFQENIVEKIFKFVTDS